MEYRVNGTTLKYVAEGSAAWGDDQVMLDGGIDLTLNTAWAVPGFGIEKLYLDEGKYTEFQILSRELVRKCWRSAGLKIPEQFDLTQYHHAARDLPTHLAAVEKTKLVGVDQFPLGIKAVENRISEICKIPLAARNPYDDQTVFHFRVIRPQQMDNNPLHRDVWLEDYDSCINLYIPVAGSDALSSLILLKGSHRWPENRVKRTIGGALMNGLKFNVPAVTAIRGDYEVIRPVPDENEALIFSPYLIHGGAVNLNPDSTRVSIELRLWKK